MATEWEDVTPGTVITVKSDVEVQSVFLGVTGVKVFDGQNAYTFPTLSEVTEVRAMDPVKEFEQKVLTVTQQATPPSPQAVMRLLVNAGWTPPPRLASALEGQL